MNGWSLKEEQEFCQMCHLCACVGALERTKRNGVFQTEVPYFW